MPFLAASAPGTWFYGLCINVWAFAGMNYRTNLEPLVCGFSTPPWGVFSEPLYWSDPRFPLALSQARPRLISQKCVEKYSEMMNGEIFNIITSPCSYGRADRAVLLTYGRRAVFERHVALRLNLQEVSCLQRSSCTSTDIHERSNISG